MTTKERKTGRPVRQDDPQKLTLRVAQKSKEKAFDLAVTRRCSIGRVFEDLVDEAHVKYAEVGA